MTIMGRLRPFASLVALLLASAGLRAQYSPPGSPQFELEAYGSTASCPYLFLGASRVQPPFYLLPTNMLLDPAGDLIWYQQAQQWALDFKLHPDGRMAYNDNVYWHILDSNFVEVDSVKCRGYANDPHELMMMADGHYFLICIEDSVMDLSSLMTTSGAPGHTNGRVDGVVIQELDAGKNVVWEWHGLDHYAIGDVDSTYFENPAILELNHTNSIDIAGGKMLLSHRATNEICQVDRATGQIDWHLGGKLNNFDLQGDVGLVGQHDARYLAGGRISTFDNGNLAHPARGLVYALDTSLLQATIEWAYADGSTQSDAMGSFRTTAGGGAIIGWGRIFPSTAPAISLIAADSTRLMDIRFRDSSATYRAICSDLPFGLRRPQLNCQVLSGQILLGVDGLHSQFEWTTGENTATIVVADTGWYQAFVPRGVGMMSTPAVHITDLSNACAALPVDPTTASLPHKKSLGIYDLLGRPVLYGVAGQVYIERFSDGSSRKLCWLR